ncbi:Cell surface receptor IPT/TIG domain protein, partial [mine drainage metagenome]
SYATGSGGSYTAALSSLSPGLHTLYAAALDGQEATLSSSGSFSSDSVPSSPFLGAIDAYTFFVGPPQVTELSTALGPNSGGTGVTISGQSLGVATSVYFGGASAQFAINPDGSLSAVSPPGTGTVEVSVYDGTTGSAYSAAAQFSYGSANGGGTASLTSVNGLATTIPAGSGGNTFVVQYTAPAGGLQNGQ